MSVELEIRTGCEIAAEKLVDCVARALQPLGKVDVQWKCSTRTIDASLNAQITANGAEVDLLSLSLGQDKENWTTVSIVTRTPESFLLLAAVAAALAALWNTTVVDDTGLFKRGVKIEAQVILDLINESAGASFSESARRFCELFKVSFGQSDSGRNR